MAKFPNPLQDDFDLQPPQRARARILSDRGIRQAIEHGLIRITPELNEQEQKTRIQPASLDMRLKFMEGLENLENGGKNDFEETLTLKQKRTYEITFTENVDPFWFRNGEYCFFGASIVPRSSVVRLGGFATNSALMRNAYEDLSMTQFSNLGPNPIPFEYGEKIGQIFFHPIPFADTYGQMFDAGSKPKLKMSGNIVRSLDMGVEVIDESEIANLIKEGHLAIYENNSQIVKMQKGFILIHATRNAWRLKQVPGGIPFARRKEYPESEILEEIDIKEGYEIKPFEHLIVKAQERFALSPHVGIKTYDNIFNTTPEGRPIPHIYNFLKRQKTREAKDLAFRIHMETSCMNVTWFDPGYSGIVTHFPKNPGRIIKPGDVIGYAQVYYFPSGVERPYGSKELGSQYQGQSRFQLAAK